MARGGIIPRILPGKRMAGHHGDKQATVQNLQIVKVIKEKNALLIKGAIPGPKYSIITVRSAIKQQLKKREVKPLLNRTAE